MRTNPGSDEGLADAANIFLAALDVGHLETVEALGLLFIGAADGCPEAVEELTNKWARVARELRAPTGQRNRYTRLVRKLSFVDAGDAGCGGVTSRDLESLSGKEWAWLLKRVGVSVANILARMVGAQLEFLIRDLSPRRFPISGPVVVPRVLGPPGTNLVFSSCQPTGPPALVVAQPIARARNAA
jgi:hypothetical protein